MNCLHHTLRRLVPLIGIALIALGFAYPLVRFLLLPVLPSFSPIPPNPAGSATLSPAAIGNTVGLGVAAALVVLPPGLALGFLLERRRWSGNRVLAGCIWLLFLMPSYLMTNGWQILLAMPALRDGAWHRLFFSEGGMVSMLALKGLPFAVFSARAGWSAIGGELGAALRIHVRERFRQSVIILRLMLPTIGSILAVVFIEAIQDFGISATLGAELHRPLVIYAVYRSLSATPVDFVHAASLSWVLVLLAGGAVLVHLRLNRRASGLVHGRRQAFACPSCSPTGRLGATLATLAVALAGFGIPVMALVGQAVSPQDATPGGGVLHEQDWRSLGYSAFYASLSALLALLVASAVLATAMNRTGHKGLVAQVLNWLTLGNMAVPSVAVGAAYVIGFNVGWLPLYGTPLLLVMAYVATHLPMLIRFLQAPVEQIHASLGDAARLHGLPLLSRLEQIHAPLLLRPLSWAWAMSFASIFFELPLSELLYPAGRAPVAVQILAFDESLHYVAEAKLALAAIGVCLLLVLTVVLLAPLVLLRPAEKPPISTRILPRMIQARQP